MASDDLLEAVRHEASAIAARVSSQIGARREVGAVVGLAVSALIAEIAILAVRVAKLEARKP